MTKPSSNGDMRLGPDKRIASFVLYIINEIWKKCNIFMVVFWLRGWYNEQTMVIYVSDREARHE